MPLQRNAIILPLYCCSVEWNLDTSLARGRVPPDRLLPHDASALELRRWRRWLDCSLSLGARRRRRESDAADAAAGAGEEKSDEAAAKVETATEKLQVWVVCCFFFHACLVGDT